MNSFCFIVQATGDKHYSYVDDLINSMANFLCLGSKRRVIIFTDKMSVHDSEFMGLVISYRQPPEIRKDTCRDVFDCLLAEKKLILEYDFVYKVDADMLIYDMIKPEEIMPKHTFVGLQHFSNKTQKDDNYVPETCSAFIPLDKRNTPAWQSCIFGGTSTAVLKMAEELKEMIGIDVKKNVHWGAWEEPYVNWYFNKHADTVRTLTVNYATPLHWYKFARFFRERYLEAENGLPVKIFHFNSTAWNHTR